MIEAGPPSGILPVFVAAIGYIPVSFALAAAGAAAPDAGLSAGATRSFHSKRRGMCQRGISHTVSGFVLPSLVRSSRTRPIRSSHQALRQERQQRALVYKSGVVADASGEKNPTSEPNRPILSNSAKFRRSFAQTVTVIRNVRGLSGASPGTLASTQSASLTLTFTDPGMACGEYATRVIAAGRQ